jgi:hypothetical protein
MALQIIWLRILHVIWRHRRVLAYLGRYTHRVTISNSRLIALVDGQVSFRWRPSRRIHSRLTAVRTRR